MDDPPINRWERQGALLEAIRITESIRGDGDGLDDLHRRLSRLTATQRDQLARALDRLLGADQR